MIVLRVLVRGILGAAVLSAVLSADSQRLTVSNFIKITYLADFFAIVSNYFVAFCAWFTKGLKLNKITSSSLLIIHLND